MTNDELVGRLIGAGCVPSDRERLLASLDETTIASILQSDSSTEVRAILRKFDLDQKASTPVTDLSE